MHANENLLIIATKKNTNLANLLVTESRKAGYKVTKITDSEYEKSSQTKWAPRTIFLEDSKPLKQYQDSLDTVFNFNGMLIKIGADEAVIDVDQTSFDLKEAKNVYTWYTKEATQRMSVFNGHDSKLHKSLHNVGKTVDKSFNGKKGKFFNPNPLWAIVSPAVTVTQSLTGGLAVASGMKVHKQDLIDDADIALVYLFKDYYLDDFMNADSSEKISYKTKDDIRADLDRINKEE